MKKNLIQMAVAITLFLSASPTAFGQELIRKALQQICDTSIIRVKNNDTSLVYNDHYASSFMLMKPSASSIFASYIDPIHVNDFEVIGNNVFFCGYLLEKSDRKAVVGHFNLNQFPSGNVVYNIFDPCTEFKKIDYYDLSDNWGGSERHLVLTGTTGTRTDAIVDVTVGSTLPPPPIFYNFQAYFSQNEDENFDDVAVTANYVVISSRRTVQQIPIIDFLQFDKPTALGTSITSSTCHHTLISSPIAETQVLLEYEKDDDYAAVFKVNGFSIIDMLHLTAPMAFNLCLEIFITDYYTSLPIEIKYNQISKVYDVLICDENARNATFYVPMQILHITPAVLNNTTVYGDITIIRQNLIWSIDPTRNAYFAASGHSSHYPKWFRYTHNTWSDCTTRSTYEFLHGNLKPIFTKEDPLNFRGYAIPRNDLSPIPFTIDINTECEQ